jgi:hypothetical protein
MATRLDDLDIEGPSGFGVDHHIYAEHQEALMPHRNAPLPETGRLRLARCVVEDGWPVGTLVMN